jgi:hypothetical protein
MKKLFCLLSIFLAGIPAIASAAVITHGDIGNGSYSGTVTSSNAWITSNALDGDAVNFWTFSATANALLSIVVESTDIEFGLSVYSGLVDDMELLFAGFDNAANFGDNQFVAGTNPVTGAIGTSLLNVLLPFTGFYTIAVGGEMGFDFPGSFDYTMRVNVPEPETLGLVAIALLGMTFALRRRA